MINFLWTISHNISKIWDILKPLHTIGKVSLNASILYKNQEICNKTNLWKFQLISLFLLRENSKNEFSIFVLILMAGISQPQQFFSELPHVLPQASPHQLNIGSYFTNYLKTITHQAEKLQGKLSTIVIFIPYKLCVNLWTFFVWSYQCCAGALKQWIHSLN